MFGIFGIIYVLHLGGSDPHQHRVMVVFKLLPILHFIVSSIVFICSQYVTYRHDCKMFGLCF